MPPQTTHLTPQLPASPTALTPIVEAAPPVASSEFDNYPCETLDRIAHPNPNRNFSEPTCSPILTGWIQPNFSDGLLTTAELRRLTGSVPVRDPATSPEEFGQLLSPDLRNTPHVDSSIQPLLIQDNQVRTVGYEQDPASVKPNEQPQAEADDSAAGSTTKEDSIDEIKSKIDVQRKLISENESFDEATKTGQLEQINSANIWIQKATAAQASIDERRLARANFEKDLSDKQELLAKPKVAMTPGDDQNSEQLQMQIQERRQLLQEQKTLLAAIETDLETRDKRITELPGLRAAALELIKKTKQRVAELANQPEATTKPLTRLALQAQKLAAEKQLEALDTETLYQEQRGKLLPLDRDLKTRKVKRLETEIEAWDKAFNRRREMEIAQQQFQAREAYSQAIQAAPELASLAETNKWLAENRSFLTDKIKKTIDRRGRVQADFEELDNKLKSLTQKIDAVGKMTPANGMLLVEHRSTLMLPFQSQARIQEIKAEVQKIRLARLELREKRESLQSPEELVAQLVDRGTMKAMPMDQVETMARELTETQLKYLEDLENDYKKYVEALSLAEQSHLNLVNKIRETREYISEKALWVRSANPLSLADIGKSKAGFDSFFHGSNWEELLGTIQARVKTRPYESALGAFIMMGLFFVSRRLRAHHE